MVFGTRPVEHGALIGRFSAELGGPAALPKICLFRLRRSSGSEEADLGGTLLAQNKCTLANGGPCRDKIVDNNHGPLANQCNTLRTHLERVERVRFPSGEIEFHRGLRGRIPGSPQRIGHNGEAGFIGNAAA